METETGLNDLLSRLVQTTFKDALRASVKDPATFLSFPGEEKAFGGCLSSGRGFVHVSASGDLEPCPFAPYSDTSLQQMSFKDALGSKFLERIRDNHTELFEADGGCATWK